VDVLKPLLKTVVNRWFFGNSYDSATANQPLPAGATVQSNPELLNQPLRIRASAVPGSPTFVAQGSLKPDGTPHTEPPLTTEEAEYRRAWFRSRSDAEWSRPFGMELFESMEFIRDYGYWGGIWRDNTVPNMRGIGDNIAEGYEAELTINPTDNWRIIANVAKTETTTGNAWAKVKEFIDVMSPTVYDGWNGNDIPASLTYWERDGWADVDAWGNNGNQMLGTDFFNDVEKSYLRTKEGEGKSVEPVEQVDLQPGVIL
jgi:hypothetical protein